MSLKLEMAWNYCNVFVVLEAIALFMFFKNVNIESSTPVYELCTADTAKIRVNYINLVQLLL